MTSLSTGLPESALALVQANCNRAYTSLCYINFSAENFRYRFFFLYVYIVIGTDNYTKLK